MITYIIFIDLNIKRKEVRQETSENTENMFHCSENIIFYSENTENDNMHFISSIFSNTFIYKYNFIINIPYIVPHI